MSKIGINPGNSPSLVTDFEAVIGRKVDYIVMHGGHASRNDLIGSVRWVRDKVGGVDREKWWSPHPFEVGATLAGAAAGSHDDVWRQQARDILAATPQAVIPLRLFQECNGGWDPWSVKGGADAFKAAFQRCVGVFRNEASAAGRAGAFLIEWNNANTGQHDPVYPGGNVVDIVGMTCYNQTRFGEPTDARQAWDQQLNRANFSLGQMKFIAAGHDKPWAITEWAVDTNNMDFYIEQMARFADDPDCMVLAQWGTDGGYRGRTGYQMNAGAYARAFAPSVWPSALPAPDPTPDPTPTPVELDVRLVDVATGTMVVLTGGATIPAAMDSATIQVVPSAEIDSVNLRLVNSTTSEAWERTERISPYVLHGDVSGRITGAPLPAGSYQFTATALVGGRTIERSFGFTVLGVLVPDDCEAQLEACRERAAILDAEKAELVSSLDACRAGAQLLQTDLTAARAARDRVILERDATMELLQAEQAENTKLHALLNDIVRIASRVDQ